MSEEEINKALAILEDKRLDIRTKMKSLRKEWLNEETKLIDLNLQKDKLEEQLKKLSYLK